MPIPQLTRRNYGRIPGNEQFSKKDRRRNLLRRVGLVVLVGAAACFIIGTGVVAWVSRDLPDPNKLSERQISQSTKIYDRTGEHLLYEIYQNQKRTLVEMDQIADYAKQATVAIEDKHFYEHKGVRVISILRAGFNNLIGRKTGSGGASTLTQQLIKNTIVGNRRKGIAGYFRKIKEAILAIRLEKKYSKNEILKSYLNEIPYGSTNYGIESASQSYFRKRAKDLTLPEAATLAAIIQAPSRYLNNPAALEGRRNTVLTLMQQQGYITEQQKLEARSSTVKLHLSGGSLEAPHFVLHVKQLLADQFGEKAIDEGGLKVITSLDWDRQKIAEKVVKEIGDKNMKEANANNAALVAMDPKTGQVLAMVGSRDFNDETIDGKFNVAVLGKRQPGSSFKPFVYTAAFEKGYTPETVLYDTRTNFGNNYIPKNFDGKERGLITMRKALQGSLNIPAVKTLYLVGIKETIEFGRRFGYTTLNENAGLSLVLGGSEVTLFEHTAAYAGLANNGVYNSPISILKVTNPQNETLYEWKPNSEQMTKAVEPWLAAMISNVLSDDPSRAYIFGANGYLTLPGRPVAAKTGTTNDNKDAWTMGYVPSLAAGVWAGNTIPSPMKAGGNRLAATIWNQFMREALKDTKAQGFPPAPANAAEKPVLRGEGGGITLEVNTITGRIASSSTPDHLKVKRTYLPPHDLLHYVLKNDPRGPSPTNPADDPQYDNWESGVQDWIKRQQAEGIELTFEEPPTEYDTSQSPELMPKLEIVSPTEGMILTTRQMELRVTASAPRGVARVIYMIDGQQIGIARDFPFGISYYAQKLTKGPHVLTAIAEDDLGNSAYKTLTFAMHADLDPPSVTWFDHNPLILHTDDFPRAFPLIPFRWEDAKEIKIYLDSTRLIYTFVQGEDKLFNNQLIFTWKNSPGSGEHQLKAVVQDTSGRTSEKILTVRVE